MKTQKLIKGLEYRIAAIKKIIALPELPRDLVLDYEARLDELETLLNYLKT